MNVKTLAKPGKHPLNFRSHLKASSPTEGEAIIVRATIAALNAVKADGIRTMETLEIMPVLPDKARGWLPDAAAKGWFPTVARRGKPITRYGKPVRPWFWYAEDLYPPDTEAKPSPIDAMARLRALKLAIDTAQREADFLRAAQIVATAAKTAIEGIE